MIFAQEKGNKGGREGKKREGQKMRIINWFCN
jgi:hypothetical protein